MGLTFFLMLFMNHAWHGFLLGDRLMFGLVLYKVTELSKKLSEKSFSWSENCPAPGCFLLVAAKAAFNNGTDSNEEAAVLYEVTEEFVVFLSVKMTYDMLDEC
jgi:hypothetical protein